MGLGFYSRLPSSKHPEFFVDIEYKMEKYLGIRVDCSPHAAPSTVQRLTHVLINLGCTIVRGTFGHEVSLKAKKEHFHWHIHVTAPKFAKAFSKQIKSAYDRQVDFELEMDPTADPVPESLTGRFSIKVLTVPEDTNRFFRYPFKDLEEIDLGLQSGFTVEELNTMLTQAKTEREIAKKTFEKHENKLNNDKQSRTLMWEWLDEKFPKKFNMSFNPDRAQDPYHQVAAAIVEYNTKYNDYKIPMDLKRRTVCYLAYRGVPPDLLAAIIL